MTDYKFDIDNIFTRKLEYDFLPGDNQPEITQSARVEVGILDDESFSVLFGLIAESVNEDSIASAMQFTCMVEVVAFVSYDKKVIIENARDLPLLANILAILFPFVRERVMTTLQSSGQSIVLQPVSTKEVLSELKDSAVTLVDYRISNEQLVSHK